MQVQRDMEVKDKQLQSVTLLLSLSHLRAEMESREAQLREEVISKEVENSRLMEELRRCQGLPQEGAGQVSHRY